jgi:hypothetical protein
VIEKSLAVSEKTSSPLLDLTRAGTRTKSVRVLTTGVGEVGGVGVCARATAVHANTMMALNFMIARSSF